MPDHHDPSLGEPDEGYSADDEGSILPGSILPGVDEPGAVEPGSGRSGGRRRRAPRRRVSGCLPLLLVVAVVVTAAAIFVPRAVDAVKGHFADPADYPGPGTGSVCFEVAPGDSVTTTGRNLKQAGVVASVEAFSDAASSASIGEGSYLLKHQMSAADALAALKKGSAGCLTKVTIVSGHTETETIKLLAQATDIKKKALTKAAKDPAGLGLPDYADGRLEGYLMGGSFQVQRGDSAASVLTQMVSQFKRSADDVDLVDGAKRLGYTPAQVVVVASLIQKEVGRPADMAKVARVIYNRLENPGTAGTSGFLQLDSTINYATGKEGFDLSPDDLGVDSPYNTRTHQGLPPGAIDSPGRAALEAALNPTRGDWYYYVTVNPRTQETKFATSYAEFLRYKAEFTQYCQTSDAC